MKTFFVRKGIKGEHFVSILPTEGNYESRESDFMEAIGKMKDKLNLPMTNAVILKRGMSSTEKDSAIMGISKASKITVKKHKEIPSDIPAQSKWEETTTGLYAKILRSLGEGLLRNFGIMKKAVADEPFTIKGRVYISPKTKKPLTRGQWKQIDRSVGKYLDKYAPELLREVGGKGQVLGVLLERMHRRGMDVESAQYKQLSEHMGDTPDSMSKLQSYLKFPDELFGMVEYALDKTADHITQINADTRASMKAVINHALVNGEMSKLQQNLEHRFGNLNRDWRRIALTEGHNAMVSGHLTSVLSNNMDKDFVFVRGSGPSANICVHCREKVMGKIFRLLKEAPKNAGQESYEDKHFGTVGLLWPGKDFMINQGVNINDWRVVYGSQHPHCRHRFVETDALAEEMRRKGEARMNEPEFLRRERAAIKRRENLGDFSSREDRGIGTKKE